MAMKGVNRGHIDATFRVYNVDKYVILYNYTTNELVLLLILYSVDLHIK